MSDPVAAVEAPAPEPTLFPGITPHESDPPSTPASLVEKIKSVSGKVFEKHGVLFRRRGGRPRKDGLPNKLDVPLNAPSSSIPAAASPGPALPDQAGLDPLLIKKVCRTFLKSLCSFGDRLIFSRATKVGIEPEKIQSLIASNTITTEESDSFGELAEICFRQYALKTENLPLIGCGLILAGVGTRYATTIAALNLEIKKQSFPNNTVPIK